MDWVKIFGLGYPMVIIVVIIILVIWLLTIRFVNPNESFDTNLFYAKMPNIFESKFYSNNLPNKQTVSQTPTKSLGELSFDSYIYSDIISNKIICSNYTNQADCWNNNKCQWVEKKIGDQAQGHPHGSYCDFAPKWLL